MQAVLVVPLERRGFREISPVSGELALNLCIELEGPCLALRRRKRMIGRHGKLQWAKQKKRLKLCGKRLAFESAGDLGTCCDSPLDGRLTLF